MSRTNLLQDALLRARKEKRLALIPFLTAGDPSFADSLELLDLAAKAGADVVELGMPFSDAMADGPVIQESYARALRAGMNLDRVLELVAAFRARHATPLVLMGYWNPIYRRGIQDFAADFRKAGGDGLLIVDLPLEESQESRAILREAGLNQIFLLSPTSSPARIRQAARFGSGYLYYISMAGTTGGKVDDHAAIRKRLAEIRPLTPLPLAVGFGIRAPQDIQALHGACDAVVVGSALIETVVVGKKNQWREFQALCKSLKAATYLSSDLAR